MIKNFLWIVSLLLAMTLFATAEENNNMSETEESPASQCDLQYNICMDKCGDDASEECAEQCKAAMEQCYAREEAEEGVSQKEED